LAGPQRYRGDRRGACGVGSRIFIGIAPNENLEPPRYEKTSPSTLPRNGINMANKFQGRETCRQWAGSESGWRSIQLQREASSRESVPHKASSTDTAAQPLCGDGSRGYNQPVAVRQSPVYARARSLPILSDRASPSCSRCVRSQSEEIAKTRSRMAGSVR
jgi:hypothetical protein